MGTAPDLLNAYRLVDTSFGYAYIGSGEAVAAKGLLMTQGRILTFDRDTGALKRVGANFRGNFVYKLLPMADGSVLSIGQDSISKVLRVDPQAKAANEIASFHGYLWDISASSDGKVIAFSLGNGDLFNELYVSRGGRGPLEK